MNVYLAARYSQKEEMIAKAEELKSLGIGITSHWLQEPSKPTITLKEAVTELGPEEIRAIAKTDIEDILHADYIVLFTVDPLTPTVRGGRHFESGFAYALQLLQQFGWLRARKPWKLVTVGPLENIFHYLPDVRNFQTWDECKRYLETIHNDKEKDPTQPDFPFATEEGDFQPPRCCP